MSVISLLYGMFYKYQQGRGCWESAAGLCYFLVVPSISEVGGQEYSICIRPSQISFYQILGPVLGPLFWAHIHSVLFVFLQSSFITMEGLSISWITFLGLKHPLSSIALVGPAFMSLVLIAEYGLSTFTSLRLKHHSGFPGRGRVRSNFVNALTASVWVWTGWLRCYILF